MKLRTYVLLAGLVLSATTVLAQTVTRDYDRTADFSKFKTYAWVRGTEVGDDLNHRRIVTAIDAQLQAKGLKPAGADARPDVYVAYHVAVDNDLQINANGFRFGPGASARVEPITVGTLAVEIIDASTRHVVWRAIASRDVDQKAGPEKREKNINKTAEKIFKQYPAH